MHDQWKAWLHLLSFDEHISSPSVNSQRHIGHDRGDSMSRPWRLSSSRLGWISQQKPVVTLVQTLFSILFSSLLAFSSSSLSLPLVWSLFSSELFLLKKITYQDDKEMYLLVSVPWDIVAYQRLLVLSKLPLDLSSVRTFTSNLLCMYSIRSAGDIHRLRSHLLIV